MKTKGDFLHTKLFSNKAINDTVRSDRFKCKSVSVLHYIDDVIFCFCTQNVGLVWVEWVSLPVAGLQLIAARAATVRATALDRGVWGVNGLFTIWLFKCT